MSQGQGMASMQRATGFMIVDNVSRLAEPLLKMACAVAFVGGAWGTFAYLESIVLVLMRVSLLGLEKGVVWLGGSVEDEAEFVRRSTGAFGFVFVVSAAAAVATSAALSWMGEAGLLRDAPDTAWILAAVPFQALTMVILQALVSRQHLGPTILVRNVLLPLVTFGLPLALVAAMPDRRGTLLLHAYLGGSVLAAFTSTGVFAWVFRMRFADWSAIPWPGGRLLRYSLPVSVTDIMQSIALRTDNALLFQFGGTREVEIYSVAVMVAKAIQAVRESYDGTALSVFSNPDPDGFGAEKRHAARYVAWIAMGLQQPMLWGILLFGAAGLSRLDPMYAAGYGTLLATATLFSLAVPGSLATTALMGLGRTMLLPVVQVLFLVPFVVLNALLIPSHGALGAGISLGASTLLSGLAAYVLVRRVSGAWVLDWPSVFAPLSGGLLFAPMTLIQQPGGALKWIPFAIWSAASLLWSVHVLRGAKALRESLQS